MNTKLHAVTDANGRPLSFFIAADQVSDYIGAAALLADRGYDADWFRNALEQKGIKPSIPGRKSRSLPVKYDKRRYKRRNRIEIMFGRLKDWRRVATRYDRCPTVFFSALALAATILVANIVLLHAVHAVVGSLLVAKITTEISLFAASFLIQRGLVYSSKITGRREHERVAATAREAGDAPTNLVPK